MVLSCQPLYYIVKQVDPGVECSLYVDEFVIMYRSPTIDAIQRNYNILSTD